MFPEAFLAGAEDPAAGRLLRLLKGNRRQLDEARERFGTRNPPLRFRRFRAVSAVSARLGGGTRGFGLKALFLSDRHCMLSD